MLLDDLRVLTRKGGPRYSFFISLLFYYSDCGSFCHFGDFVEILGWEVEDMGFGGIEGAAGALWKFLAFWGPGNMFL